jgi:hypothetical protein
VRADTESSAREKSAGGTVEGDLDGEFSGMILVDAEELLRFSMSQSRRRELLFLEWLGRVVGAQFVRSKGGHDSFESPGCCCADSKFLVAIFG